MAVTVVLFVITMAALLTNVVADIVSLRVLRSRHQALWLDLGRPYLPSVFLFAPGSFGDWVNRQGYLETDDAGLIRTCRTAQIAFYVGCAALLLLLVSLWSGVHYS